MNKKQASSIIENTFNKAFNRDEFIDFAGNLFNLRSTDYSQRSVGIFDTYKQHVQSLEVVAKFSDGKNEIDVLIVTLIKDTSLDKARTMQRNFVARYLSEKQGDAAIVAFTSPDAEDWRFSLIKMEYKFKATDTGVKVEQEVTPAKRWSFLVGKNENSHTAQSQLVGILANDEVAPTLEELEQAFSIETVTNEFFAKYTDLFLRMKESLDVLLENDPQLKADFESKEVDTADFAKKTMGQMAFLYFLQKKGWFGVAPDKEWGTGVKNFLREIFERRNKYGENFFDDVLEPLFYEALAQDRGNDAIYPKLNNCRMPFLNGGLFEPMNGYSWETTHIRLPDELFSNDTKTKEGDIGDGILDVFDRYNFTVNESEPLEQEVAVDPEMLGKVFENLLPENLRKGKGAFYTPRVIVHYMCQESLINYLDTETNSLIPKVDIESFIQRGSQIIQNDKSIIEQGGNVGDLLLAQSISDQANELDDLLANIKVCDPAVGSGAFPLGMLNEIVTARTILGIHLRNNTSAYNLKLHAISNSIYGVDIDPGAVEIAKLRFWLSLVVEEDEPTPLPNLDHKIMQGNSLVSQYEGIELFDDDFLNSTESIEDEKNEIQEKLNEIQKEYFSLHSAGEFTTARKTEIEEEIKRLQRRLKFLNNKYSNSAETGSLFDAPYAKKIAQQKAKLLQSKIAQYITVDSKTNKEDLKLEIDDLKWDLIEATLEERDETDKLGEIKKLRKDRVKPFFIWKLEFGKVFKNNGGFDVVIGNPPYVNTKDIAKYNWRSSLASEFGWVDDLYNHFTHLALTLSKSKGIISFITSDTFFTIQSKSNMRKLLLENEIIHIIPTPKAFSAMVDTAIFIVKKNRNSCNYLLEFSDIRKPNFDKLGFNKQFIKSKGSEISTWERILNPLFANLNSGGCYTKQIKVDLFRNNLNQVFFSPSEMNLQIKKNTIPDINKLYERYWNMIKTSSDIVKNSAELDRYRTTLKPGNLTLLGLVTEGGQGMATGNNGKFVGCLKGTKSADRILETRYKRLYKAFTQENVLYQLYPDFLDCTTENDFNIALSQISEHEIRNLFDEIKLKTNRRIFGQGYLFKIIDASEVTNISVMTDNEKKNGISNNRKDCFVMYDKGDRDGNKWFAKSPYYIKWSENSVNILRTDKKARWQGYDFYFRSGFCWTNVLNTNSEYIKSRIKNQSVNDVGTMALYPLIKNINAKYLVCILNSYFIFKLLREFLNASVNLQINDMRKFPIIVPTESKLKEFEHIFDCACTIKEKQFSEEVSKEVAMQQLDEIQKKLDKMVYSLYGIG
jgi:hypothetical protein